MLLCYGSLRAMQDYQRLCDGTRTVQCTLTMAFILYTRPFILCSLSSYGLHNELSAQHEDKDIGFPCLLQHEAR